MIGRELELAENCVSLLAKNHVCERFSPQSNLLYLVHNQSTSSFNYGRKITPSRDCEKSFTNVIFCHFSLSGREITLFCAARRGRREVACSSQPYSMHYPVQAIHFEAKRRIVEQQGARFVLMQPIWLLIMPKSLTLAAGEALGYALLPERVKQHHPDGPRRPPTVLFSQTPEKPRQSALQSDYFRYHIRMLRSWVELSARSSTGARCTECTRPTHRS